MITKNLARVEGQKLTLRMIRPEDADYVHGLRTDPAYNRHFSEVRGKAEDQHRWIDVYKVREAALRELWGEKCLSSRQNQATFTSEGSPLGEYRFGSLVFHA